MIELNKNIFDCIFDPEIDAICITTNGECHGNRAIMKKGLAAEAAKKWKRIPDKLGQFLTNTNSNIPFILGALDSDGNYLNVKNCNSSSHKCLIYSFPIIDNLSDGLNLELIEKSAVLISGCASTFGLKHLVCPKFEDNFLSWENHIKPILKNILDDRFIICSSSDN